MRQPTTPGACVARRSDCAARDVEAQLFFRRIVRCIGRMRDAYHRALGGRQELDVVRRMRTRTDGEFGRTAFTRRLHAREPILETTGDRRRRALRRQIDHRREAARIDGCTRWRTARGKQEDWDSGDKIFHVRRRERGRRNGSKRNGSKYTQRLRVNAQEDVTGCTSSTCKKKRACGHAACALSM